MPLAASDSQRLCPPPILQLAASLIAPLLRPRPRPRPRPLPWGPGLLLACSPRILHPEGLAWWGHVKMPREAEMASRFEMDHGDGEGGTVGITDPVAGGSVAVFDAALRVRPSVPAYCVCARMAGQHRCNCSCSGPGPLQAASVGPMLRRWGGRNNNTNTEGVDHGINKGSKGGRPSSRGSR